ncbi:SDR family NAD(P)-dependent oxidoreductase [Kiloniella laminariae]|uniref:SDR family NAD(P)-dependent oxidoreductase n=1 Tax=Kiloniella laminariae TaxID=454162 RepID=A0ABT4LH35_9PROT|nr:SDR family NAD(P)-dependent oxidoreductase [Kiloniella laminariae]MCZ4280412.1 SDR family NAD(P)-dependent oxidoreductase [Kiloniella laminariae]
MTEQTPLHLVEGRLEGRLALITGASRGIGRAVAKRFAAEGAQLLLMARTVGALEELDDEIRAAGGKNPVLIPHDLKEMDGLDHLGASLFERYGKLDVLVGNAGSLGPLSPIGHIKPKVWQEVFDINVTANYRLIRSLDPLLRKSDAGRAIFVTTSATAKAYWSVYKASKAALNTLVQTYADEVEKTTVRANLISPGPMRTAMREKAFPGEDPMSLPAPESITDIFVELASASYQLNGQFIDLKQK